MAAFLDVPPERIQAWLEGVEATPLDIFLRSLDVIADGPYASRIRVAAIRPR